MAQPKASPAPVDKRESPAPVDKREWLNIVDDTNQTVGAINIKTGKAKIYLDDKERAFKVLFDAVTADCNARLASQPKAPHIEKAK